MRIASSGYVSDYEAQTLSWRLRVENLHSSNAPGHSSNTLWNVLGSEMYLAFLKKGQSVIFKSN